MSLLPARLDDGDSLSPRQVEKARRLRDKAELEVYRHALDSRALAEIDRLDTQAIADASRAALEAEFDLLEYGMARAGQSAAKLAIVSRHVERLTNTDDRRISRRFGE